MRDAEKTTRHWMEKAHAALLAVLRVQKAGVLESQNKPPTRRRLLQQTLAGLNFTVWPFDSQGIPPPAAHADSIEKLQRKIAQGGRDIEATTEAYITPIHFGQPFPGWGQTLPQCAVTIDAERKFDEYLQHLAESYGKTRADRCPAVLRKISHAFIVWWGIVYGAWPGARNQFTIESLSWEEGAELLNFSCFAGCETHTPEQVRKMVGRMIADVKRSLPAANPAVAAVHSGTASKQQIEAFIKTSRRGRARAL